MRVNLQERPGGPFYRGQLESDRKIAADEALAEPCSESLVESKINDIQSYWRLRCHPVPCSVYV